MTNDQFLKAFKTITMSVAILIASIALLVYSVKSANASNFPEIIDVKSLDGKLTPNSTMAIGKYMMSYQLVYDVAGNELHHFILVWDTETGKNKIYVRQGSTFNPSAGQMPATPLQ